MLTILGNLTFKEAPDFEKPADSNRDNVYMVTVVVTDAGVDSNKRKLTARAGRDHYRYGRGRRRDCHPIVGAAQGRNRADRHSGWTLTALSPTVSSGRGTLFLTTVANEDE